ncbi:hypothetical protein K439DRAFT_1623824 [Ramaria rubella]|nr:hypothetical protein K439DRAFT_1623824 [Ramaria rubella]
MAAAPTRSAQGGFSLGLTLQLAGWPHRKQETFRFSMEPQNVHIAPSIHSSSSDQVLLSMQASKTRLGNVRVRSTRGVSKRAYDTSLPVLVGAAVFLVPQASHVVHIDLYGISPIRWFRGIDATRST